MKKIEQIKVKHHYVWSRYLKNWSEGNNIFYTTQKGKIASDSIKGLCRECYFYQLPILNQNDIRFLSQFSQQCDDFLQEQHNSFLSNLVALSSLMSMLQERMDGTNEDMLKEVDIIENNVVENMYSVEESAFLPVFEKLSEGNSECLLDVENMISFCSYIGHQLARTSKVKRSTFSGIDANQALLREHPDKLQIFRKTWPCISFMLGMNIGFNLYATRNSTKHVFIRNTSNVPFITSDSPVINIHPSVARSDNSTPPEGMDLFFPLSPKYAYFIAESDFYGHIGENALEQDVIILNARMFQNSEKVVFANSKAAIESVRNSLKPKQHNKSKHSDAASCSGV